MAQPIKINARDMAEMEALAAKLKAQAEGGSAGPPTTAGQSLARTAAARVPIPEPAPAATHAAPSNQNPAWLALTSVHAALGAGHGIGGGGLTSQLAGWTQFATLIGRVNPVVLGVTTALAALAAATVGAAQRLSEFGQATAQTGGTAGQVSLGRTLMGALGLDPGGFTGLAANLRNRIANDPLAMAEAGRAGIRALPREFGTANEAKILVDIIKSIQASGSQRAATQMANRYGMPELAAAFQVPPDAIKRAEEFAKQVGDTYTTDATTKARDFNLLLEQVKEGFGALVVTVGAPLLSVINSILKAGPMLADALGAAFIPGYQAHGQKKPETIQEQQLAAQKQAVEELKVLRQGIFGGGQRASGAIPPGLRGDALEHALRAHAIRLGAF